MADPRKPVLTPSDPQETSSVVLKYLLVATELGSREIGATGASFVLIGMGVWSRELYDLDGKAAAKFLHSLGTLFDPKSNDGQKRRAEQDRAQAVRALLAAVDLDMAKEAGRG